MLTEELMPLIDLPIERGNRVGPLNADAIVCNLLHIEMDRDTEGYDAVKRQMEAYRKATLYNVWLVPTEARMRGIMEIGTEWSMYSVCGSGVWIDSTENRIGVDQVRDLIQGRTG
jgi:hypothetical protein